MSKAKEIELRGNVALELLWKNNYIETILTIKKDNTVQYSNIHFNKEYFN